MSTVKITLPKKEAFTLLGVLARYAYDGKQLEVSSAREGQALKLLCEALDDELVERYREDYKKLVAKIRSEKKDT